ncbi:MAG: hypothetical protein QM756_11670 [Polyangiaceae bacterium]
MKTLHVGLGALVTALGLCAFEGSAHAQSTDTERSDAWGSATNITAVSAMGLVLLMPRVFYSDPEVTVGWKARWHLSVLAPSMTLATLGLVNEIVLKDELKGFRPGCSDETTADPNCKSYGMFSSPTFGAFSAFGQGAGIFLVDTLKWSGGRFNFGPFMGDVVAPGVLAVITGIGRSAGNWESGGQVWGTAAASFAIGMGIGTLYAVTQRPECGYTGSLICW